MSQFAGQDVTHVVCDNFDESNVSYVLCYVVFIVFKVFGKELSFTWWDLLLKFNFVYEDLERQFKSPICLLKQLVRNTDQYLCKQTREKNIKNSAWVQHVAIL